MLRILFSANSWAPMQHMIIIGLDNLEDSRTSSLALTWAERWIQSNFIAFNKTGEMYEKYIATELGGFGGGILAVSYIFNVNFKQSLPFTQNQFT